MFNGKLGKVKLTYGDSPPEVGSVFGLYYPADDPIIHIDSRVTTRRMLINTLAHEMVHQLQHQQGTPITHNVFFRREGKRLAKFDILI